MLFTEMGGFVEKTKSEKIEEGAAPVRTEKMSVRKLRRDGVSIPPIVKMGIRIIGWTEPDFSLELA